MTISGVAEEKSKLANILVASVDKLIVDAIQQTPSLSETQLRVIQNKRQHIKRIVNHLLLPPSFESFLFSHRQAVWLVWIFSLGTVGAVLIFDHNRITIIGQIFLAYGVAILGSWCFYYVGIILTRDLAPVFSILVIGVAIIAFGIILWFWLSPFSPVHVRPKVSSSIGIPQGTGMAYAASVTGEALLPPGVHLWIVAGRGNQWWPLHEAEIDGASGQWVAKITATDIHIGCEATVRVVTITDKGNEIFHKYLQVAGKTLPSIMLPDDASKQQEFNVRLPNCQPRSTGPGQSGGNITIPSQLDFTPNPTPARRIELQNRLMATSEHIRNRPNDPAAYLDRGLLYSDLGDQDSADADFSQSIILGVSPESIEGRGLARLRKGWLDEAIQDFASARDLDPQNHTYTLNLDTAEQVANDTESTIEYLKAALGHRPADGELYFRLGIAYEKHHDYALARATLAQAIASGDAALQERANAELHLIP